MTVVCPTPRLALESDGGSGVVDLQGPRYHRTASKGASTYLPACMVSSMSQLLVFRSCMRFVIAMAYTARLRTPQVTFFLRERPLCMTDIGPV